MTPQPQNPFLLRPSLRQSLRLLGHSLRHPLQRLAALIAGCTLSALSASLWAQTNGKQPTFQLVAAPAAVAQVQAQTQIQSEPATPSTLAAAPNPNAAFEYPTTTGEILCADGVKVGIYEDPNRFKGYNVQLGHLRYPVTRVPTESGAIRLENKASGIVWLQMSNKSMLFNEKLSRRLATDCRDSAQQLAEATLNLNAQNTLSISSFPLLRR